jgi:hypothetical protein
MKTSKTLECCGGRVTRGSRLDTKASTTHAGASLQTMVGEKGPHSWKGKKRL